MSWITDEVAQNLEEPAASADPLTGETLSMIPIMTVGIWLKFFLGTSFLLLFSAIMWRPCNVT